MSTSISVLKDAGVCYDAIAWAKQFPDLETAWAACQRGDWMFWWAGIQSGPPESKGRKRLMLAVCECARLTLPYARDPDALKCIETAESWARSDGATMDEVRAAREKVDTAAAAYHVAAVADTYAAASFATYVVYAAVTATARGETFAQCCADIVRRHYPQLP